MLDCSLWQTSWGRYGCQRSNWNIKKEINVKNRQTSQRRKEGRQGEKKNIWIGATLAGGCWHRCFFLNGNTDCMLTWCRQSLRCIRYLCPVFSITDSQTKLLLSRAEGAFNPSACKSRRSCLTFSSSGSVSEKGSDRGPYLLNPQSYLFPLRIWYITELGKFRGSDNHAQPLIEEKKRKKGKEKIQYWAVTLRCTALKPCRNAVQQ